MALVQGEDTESDEEINTDQLQHLTLTPDGSLKGFPKLTQQDNRSKAGIVAGEESETDEEDEGTDGKEETDGGGGHRSLAKVGEGQDHVGIQPPSQTGGASLKGTGRKTSQDSASSAPQSYVCRRV